MYNVHKTHPKALPADVADVVLGQRVALVGVRAAEVVPVLARVRDLLCALVFQ